MDELSSVYKNNDSIPLMKLYADLTALNCVWMVLDRSSKKFQIFKAKRFIDSFSRFLADMETKKFASVKNDIENIEVIILEKNIDDENLPVRLGCLAAFYLNEGYSLYHEYNYPKYVIQKVRGRLRGMRRHIVYVKPTGDDGKQRKLIGLFESVDQMESFLAIEYPQGVQRIVRHPSHEDRSDKYNNKKDQIENND